MSFAMDQDFKPIAVAGWNTVDLANKYFSNSEPQRQVFFKTLFSRLNFGIEEKNDFRLLDYGCGDGKNTGVMSFLFREVIGIDISEAMIQVALNRFPKEIYPNLTFDLDKSGSFSEFSRNIDAESDKFDIITSFFVLHFAEEPIKTLRNIYSALKEGGKFVATIVSNRIYEEENFLKCLQEGLVETEFFQPRLESKKSITRMEDVLLVLEQAGFLKDNISAIEREACFRMTREEITNWCKGCYSAMFDIPRESESTTFGGMLDRYIEMNPSAINADGFISFQIFYIDILAVKAEK
jgi:SAM-dependent methyltransferase